MATQRARGKTEADEGSPRPTLVGGEAKRRSPPDDGAERALRVGLHVPPFGELAEASVLAELAGSAETSGFDGMFLWDHVFRGGADLAVAEPWVSLTAMALATSHLVLGPLVTPLTRRRPQQLARQTATLDRLSGGRLVLGVGLGVDTGGELGRLGEVTDRRIRAERLDEGLDILRKSWTGRPVVHRGRQFLVDGVSFLPRPSRGMVPVWVAATRPEPSVVRRAARADGICPETTPDGLAELVSLVATARGSMAGYEVVSFGRPCGSPGAWREAGATWWLLQLPVGTSSREAFDVVAGGPPR